MTLRDLLLLSDNVAKINNYIHIQYQNKNLDINSA